MKRIQLFEFEDFNWFPDWIRTCMTNLILVLHKMIGTKEVIASLLADIQKKWAFTQIVDMGSGSGGIMPEAVRTLNDQNPDSPTNLLLTDLHPSGQFVDYINNQGIDHIRYSPAPLDALHLSKAPKGLKTMIASFHHMPPATARQILKSAQDNDEALLIYELSENNIPLIVWWVLLPISLVLLFIMSLFMTPFSSPLSFKQILFTYLIPAIPICYAWDGQASLPRTYTFEDVRELLKDIPDENYTWEIEKAKKKNGKAFGYYILGLPNKK